MREITAPAFDSDVLQASWRHPVLVDISAPWCAPCNALVPHLEALAARYNGRMDVVKVNGDNAPAIVQAYGVRTYPTLLLFRNGQPVKTHSGSPGSLSGLLAFVGPHP